MKRIVFLLLFLAIDDLTQGNDEDLTVDKVQDNPATTEGSAFISTESDFDQDDPKENSENFVSFDGSGDLSQSDLVDYYDEQANLNNNSIIVKSDEAVTIDQFDPDQDNSSYNGSGMMHLFDSTLEDNDEDQNITEVLDNIEVGENITTDITTPDIIELFEANDEWNDNSTLENDSTNETSLLETFEEVHDDVFDKTSTSDLQRSSLENTQYLISRPLLSNSDMSTQPSSPALSENQFDEQTSQTTQEIPISKVQMEQLSPTSGPFLSSLETKSEHSLESKKTSTESSLSKFSSESSTESSLSTFSSESSPEILPNPSASRTPEIFEILSDNLPIDIAHITDLVNNITMMFNRNESTLFDEDFTESKEVAASNNNKEEFETLTTQNTNEEFIYEEQDIDSSLDNCDCICDHKVRYKVDSGEEEKIDFVLQGSSHFCSDENLERCCTVVDFKPLDVESRIRFPDDDEINIAEDILIDAQGVPRLCHQFIQNNGEALSTTTSTILEKEEKNSTIILSEETEEQKISHHIGPGESLYLELNLNQDYAVEIKGSARTRLPIIGLRSGAPNLVEFELVDILELGRMELKVLLLEVGDWRFKIENMETFQQEILLTINIKPLDYSLNLYMPGCKWMYGQQICTNTVSCVHGYRSEGGCKCNPGWTGVTCKIRLEKCGEELCTGRGDCVWDQDKLQFKRLHCNCSEGYTGQFCETRTCPNCSKGVCDVSGTCSCFQGWGGENCSEPVLSLETVCPMQIQSQPDECTPECVNGLCEAGVCICNKGWEGESCSIKMCDPRCTVHGTCEGGVCSCDEGWGGTHCTLDYCPQSCSGHGSCVKNSKIWSCSCSAGWYGPSCSIPIENSCDNGLDDDEDGLVDCEDPECCWSESCARSQYCSSVPDPVSRLEEQGEKRDEEQEEFVSFFDKNKFLIEKGSVQSYANIQEFDPRRVSIIRGQVLTERGEGLVGVRVSVSGARGQGFTLTRSDGWFDILVNGGGSVTLRFGKSPFSPATNSIFLSWNEIKIMDEIKLYKNNPTSTPRTTFFCIDHQGTRLNSSIDITTLVSNEGVLREEFPLKYSTVNLVYTSKYAQGYYPKMRIQLLGDSYPSSLLSIYTRISVEGVVHNSVHEVDKNLNYEFIWNKRDSYGRKVYGQTTAEVRIGYKYKMCPDIIWRFQLVTLHGDSPSPWRQQLFPGWSFDILHRYNAKDAILYKGDGDVIDLKEREKLVIRLNENFTKTIIGPQAMLADGEGNIYVGDSTFIRKIDHLGRATDLLRLNSSSALNRYYLALDPVEQFIYMSDPTNFRIIKIDTQTRARDLFHNNFQVVLGGLGKCLVNDETDCGDGKEARHAKLVFPKGLGFMRDGELIFIDGTSLRILNLDGTVETVAGAHKLASEWKPQRCGSEREARDANLNWPTYLAVNKLENIVGIVDQGSVLEIDLNGRLTELLSASCKGSKLEFLPKSLSYTHQGQLILVDEKNRIYESDKTGEIREIAGSLAYCKRQENGCMISDFNHIISTGSKARFSGISGICTGPDGALYVADEASHQISLIRNHLPKLNPENRYEILSVETQELFVFDERGIHLQTRGVFASATGYAFFQDSQSVMRISDTNSNVVALVKNPDKGFSILLPTGKVYEVKADKRNNLEFLRSPDNLVHVFKYLDNSGLLNRIFTGGKFQSVFEYGLSGELVDRLTPVPPTMLIEPTSLYTAVVKKQENELVKGLYDFEYLLNPLPSTRDLVYNSTTKHRTNWGYFIHVLNSRSSFGNNVDGIGKRFLINGVELFTSELHPRSMLQSIYQDGTQLLKIEHYNVPKRTFYLPYPAQHWVDQQYDKAGRPTLWEWAGKKELLEYDSQGRISTISNCYNTILSYSYNYNDSTYPSEVWKNQSEYKLQHDNIGGLQSISTPLGHQFYFHMQAVLGHYALYFKPPWLDSGLRFDLDFNGMLLRITNVHEAVQYLQNSSRTQVITHSAILTETLLVSTKSQLVQDLVSGINMKTAYKYTRNGVLSVFCKENSTIFEYNCAQKDDTNTVSIDCNGTLYDKSISFQKQFDVRNQKEIKYNEISITASLHTLVYSKHELQLKVVEDIYGNEERVELKVKNNPIYTRATEYNCIGQITKISEKMSSQPTITSFTYTTNGHISTIRTTPGASWSYGYDDNGNFIHVDYGIGNSTFQYEFGERVVNGGFNKVLYSETGNMVAVGEYRFEYNQLNQLILMSYGVHSSTELIYDMKGRVIEMENKVSGTLIALLYMDEINPWLVTHVYNSKSKQVTTLTYTRCGLLLSVQVEDKEYLVITNSQGTPTHLFNTNGEVIKELVYTPFGALLSDTNPDLEIFVGFQGGISVSDSRVLIIEGRPYESLLGSWMVPDYLQILNLSTDPAQLVHLYRFKGNDPINDIKTNYYHTLDSWLKYFKFDLELLKSPLIDPDRSKGYKTKMIELPRYLQVGKPPQSKNTDFLDPALQKMFTLQCDQRRPELGNFYHVKSPLLGPNILIKRTEHKLLTQTLPGASTVETLIAQLLNGSLVLENYGNLKDFYFLKHQVDIEKITSLKEYLEVDENIVLPHGREFCIQGAGSQQICLLDGLESADYESILAEDDI